MTPSRRARQPGEVEPPDLPDDLESADIVVLGDASPPAESYDHAHLEGVSFVGLVRADLTLIDSRLVDCDFSGANLDGLDVTRAEFVRCRLRGAVMTQGQFENASFVDCSFSGANFRMSNVRWARFADCDLRESDFYSATLANVVFEGCTLDGAIFEAAEVRELHIRHGSANDVRGALRLGEAVITSDLAVPLGAACLVDAGFRIYDED